jgi:Flp pilus assembly pilin Flp
MYSAVRVQRCNNQQVSTVNIERGEYSMELLKRLVVEEDGQGLVEYTLIVVLVALVFWVAIKNTNVGISWPAVGARLLRALVILPRVTPARKDLFTCDGLGRVLHSGRAR